MVMRQIARDRLQQQQHQRRVLVSTASPRYMWGAKIASMLWLPESMTDTEMRDKEQKRIMPGICSPLMIPAIHVMSYRGTRGCKQTNTEKLPGREREQERSAHPILNAAWHWVQRRLMFAVLSEAPAHHLLFRPLASGLIIQSKGSFEKEPRSMAVLKPISTSSPTKTPQIWAILSQMTFSLENTNP